MIVLAVLISTVAYSSNDDKLEVVGYFIAEYNVKFEVAIVNNDASKVVIQTRSNTFAYRIRLKIGKEYVITFMKGDKVKKLFVTADGPGYMEVDVDFNTDDAAQLCYDESADDYALTLLYRKDE